MKDCQSEEKFCASKIYKITYPDHTLHYMENIVLF